MTLGVHPDVEMLVPFSPILSPALLMRWGSLSNTGCDGEVRAKALLFPISDWDHYVRAIHIAYSRGAGVRLLSSAQAGVIALIAFCEWRLTRPRLKIV